MTGALTEYEKLRNENIARNADRLAQLGLIQAGEDVKSTAQRKRPAYGPQASPHVFISEPSSFQEDPEVSGSLNSLALI